jgi:opacity protein-like surface antigen
MRSRGWVLGWAAVIAVSLAGSAEAKPNDGKLAGVVLDPAGTPQMGATILLISEDAGGQTISRLMTNQHGSFQSSGLKPGNYTVRATLAGFLPSVERHIAVSPNFTTLLRLQVDSVFASLDQLRRKPDARVEPDDWKWVLRTSASTRTVLQWIDGGTDLDSTPARADSGPNRRPHGRVELTSGTLRPGSPSSLADSLATTISYDQPLGAAGRMLVAGRMSYERGASGAFASVWMPSGSPDLGPETTFILRQGKVGLNDALMFQGVRLDHSEQIFFGNRVSLRAGAAYLRAGMRSSTSALHPHARVDANLGSGWTASALVAANAADVQSPRTSPLESVIEELDTLPTVLFRNGHPVFEGRWHEEISASRKSDRSSVEVAVFHDSTRHQAVFGSGTASSPDFFQDAFSNAFLYDGGSSASWGAQLTYRHKVSDNLEVGGMYSWAGALTPEGELDRTTSDLRDSFSNQYHHSVAARIVGRVPRTGTQIAASYRWTSGTTLSRQDSFGDDVFDPNLHLSIHQPLPGFGLGRKWEALADFSNLLAEGYVPISGQNSRVILVPVLRSFRGGVSFQF